MSNLNQIHRDCCPHCGCGLSLKQIINLMNGSGFIRHVRVKLSDGRIVSMEARNVNPKTMTAIEHD